MIDTLSCVHLSGAYRNTITILRYLPFTAREDSLFSPFLHAVSCNTRVNVNIADLLNGLIGGGANAGANVGANAGATAGATGGLPLVGNLLGGGGVGGIVGGLPLVGGLVPGLLGTVNGLVGGLTGNLLGSVGGTGSGLPVVGELPIVGGLVSGVVPNLLGTVTGLVDTLLKGLLGTVGADGLVAILPLHLECLKIEDIKKQCSLLNAVTLCQKTDCQHTAVCVDVCLNLLNNLLGAVTGQCVCQDGYYADKQGTCISLQTCLDVNLNASG